MAWCHCHFLASRLSLLELKEEAVGCSCWSAASKMLLPVEYVRYPALHALLGLGMAVGGRAASGLWSDGVSGGHVIMENSSPKYAAPFTQPLLLLQTVHSFGTIHAFPPSLQTSVMLRVA